MASIGYGYAPPVVDPASVTTGNPVAQVPSIQGLYGQILQAIQGQPLPASTSPYGTSSLYRQGNADLNNANGALMRQQQEMRGLLDPSLFEEQERRMLNQLRYREPNRTVQLYGYQG